MHLVVDGREGVEQHQEWLLRAHAPWIDTDLPEPGPVAPDVEAAQAAAPTLAQAVAIVQHVLGAHVMQEEQ